MVVAEKLVALYAFARGVGLKPGPRESVLVFKRASVVVDAIVVSLPAFPSASHARITVSTNIAAGSTAAAASVAGASVETVPTAGSNPKNSFTESIKPRPEEPLAVIASVRQMAAANSVERRTVEGEMVG